jgi:phenylalanyl-tRNA synthetase beta chain
MLVSWNWLKDYLPLAMSPAEAAQRLMMAGLNHESTESVGDDFAIDLEITSNRPDCLGHIGIAREIGVLFDEPLKTPAAEPKATGGDVNNFAKVRVDAPDLCPRYTARLVSGVKIGPSPKWLTDRLTTLGIARINNVVDITNFVLMECGQPLHAFDFRKLAGREIVVRRAKQGETLAAIDHRIYTLDPQMCVIADSEAPVAIAGVMGGASTEITERSTEILIESADFAPLSVRSTSRKLKLRSDSSYRFERGVDPAGVDWASRRCCELILQECGGQLCTGMVDVGTKPTAREPVVLRLAQIQRILGIEVPAAEVKRILHAIGCQEPKAATLTVAAPATQVTVTSPSWRRDLTREIDLIEEVARIHGYDKIPEDASVPMTSSHRTDWERVLDKARRALTAAGFDEAMTASVVPAGWSDAFSPWTDAPALATGAPMLEGADRVRRSIVPSLLSARQYNDSLQNEAVELFETARIYLPQPAGLPVEQWSLAVTSGRGYAYVKGVLEQLLNVLGIDAPLQAEVYSGVLLDEERAAKLTLAGETLGFLGEVSTAGKKQFGLRTAATIAEINLGLLQQHARMVPQHRHLSKFPPMSRDLNLIVDESVRWSDLATTVQTSAGPLLETLRYQETYRDAAKDGANKKRLLFSFSLRSPERTLTAVEADAARDAVVSACRDKHQAVLLA